MTVVAYRADVRLARESLASLRLPVASIVDGDVAASVVRTCCLRSSGVSRLAISLPVDEATAHRFTGTCRREAKWQRVGLPVTIVVAALGLVPAIIGIVRDDLGLVLLASLIELGVAVATILIRSALIRQRSRHHPVLTRRGNVLVRGVDRVTARAWADINPPGAVQLLN